MRRFCCAFIPARENRALECTREASCAFNFYTIEPLKSPESLETNHQVAQ